MKDISEYIDLALQAFEKGFTSKASRDQALKYLNNASEILINQIAEIYLDVPFEERTKEQEDLYWCLPVYHWRQHHSDKAISVFPESKKIVEQIEEINELRETIKNAEIVKIERKENSLVSKIHKSIYEEFTKRKQQYTHGLKLVEIFGNLPVSVNVHEVTNQHGTTFTRMFFYMNGALTPFNVIVAVLEKTKKD